jgi:hypothetical protein
MKIVSIAHIQVVIQNGNFRLQVKAFRLELLSSAFAVQTASLNIMIINQSINQRVCYDAYEYGTDRHIDGTLCP